MVINDDRSNFKSAIKVISKVSAPLKICMAVRIFDVTIVSAQVPHISNKRRFRGMMAGKNASDDHENRMKRM